MVSSTVRQQHSGEFAQDYIIARIEGLRCCPTEGWRSLALLKCSTHSLRPPIVYQASIKVCSLAVNPVFSSSSQRAKKIVESFEWRL
jgi:hypothetical protein